MRFIGMVYVNCKKYLKNYVNIIMMFIFPIACIALIHGFISGSGKGLDEKAAILNLDKGVMGKQLVKSTECNSVYTNKNKALDDLKKYNVIAVYEIPENFSDKIKNNEKPDITAYKLEKGNSTQVFEANLEQKLNSMVKTEILKNNNIINNQNEIDKNFINVKYNSKNGVMASDKLVPIFLIMFYLMAFSSTLTGDLINLRNQKILRRFLSTDNKGCMIMGSIYTAMFLTQVIMYSASFIVIDVIFKYNFGNFGIFLLNVALMSMVSLSMGIMLNRIFINTSIAAVVTMLLSLVMTFLYLTGDLIKKSSLGAMSIASKFTPFYWSLESIKNSKIFPNAFVLILIVFVFFTAGNVRYSSFAREN